MADRDYDATNAGMGRTHGQAGLDRLSDLKDFEVADGYPDIRGWKVRTPDGQVLGKVDDLIVSTSEMRVRYLDVDVDRSVRSGVADAVTPKGAEAGHALVPIGTAQLDDNTNDVVVSSLAGSDLGAYPTYDRTQGISRDYEESLRSRFGGSTTGAAAMGTAATDDFYAHEHYDDDRFYASRRDSAITTGEPTASSGVDRAVGIPMSRDDSTSRGRYLVRRAGEKLDDLKDRVDGNPASRPGPDATDRRL